MLVLAWVCINNLLVALVLLFHFPVPTPFIVVDENTILDDKEAMKTKFFGIPKNFLTSL